MKMPSKIVLQRAKPICIGVVCVYVGITLLTGWTIRIGTTLMYCSGISYRPSYNTGPCNEWKFYTDSQGPCNGFTSARQVGVLAGVWQFYFEGIEGWRNNNAVPQLDGQ